MNPSKLVRMANDIAANFDYGSDRARSVAGVADHIGRFWSPTMLDEIEEFMRTGEAELTALAEQALTQLIAERVAADSGDG